MYDLDENGNYNYEYPANAYEALIDCYDAYARERKEFVIELRSFSGTKPDFEAARIYVDPFPNKHGEDMIDIVEKFWNSWSVPCECGGSKLTVLCNVDTKTVSFSNPDLSVSYSQYGAEFSFVDAFVFFKKNGASKVAGFID
jgi:hypothetical protein